MADNFEISERNEKSKDGFREAVCIDAYRVYDSCSDKDCLEDLRVYFSENAQRIVEESSNVRMRSAEVVSVYLDLEPVPFHKGFYSIDITFFFEVNLDVFGAPSTSPIGVSGISVFSKKVVLYGSEGNVKIFSSELSLGESDEQYMPAKNLPKATVQVAEPIGLSAKICERVQCCEPCCRIPEHICSKYGGSFVVKDCNKVVYATIGLFSIVQIERNVQMLVPVYDFCLPEKECTANSDNPCELFSRIEFPTNEFFPPKMNESCMDDRNYCRYRHKD